MSSNEFGDAPGIERAEAARPRRVAPREQEPRRGEHGARVGRCGAAPRRAEMGVDEAGVERAARDLGAAHQRAQEGEIGLRPDHDRVVELLVEHAQRLGAGRRRGR